MHHHLYDDFGKKDIHFYFDNFHITNAIASSVSHDAGEFADHLINRWNCNAIVLNSKTSIPLTIEYETPKTLGSDRIAAAVGGNRLFPRHSVLVIDAGTCITYDLVTADKVYKGGAISPGLKMRYEAMHHFTRNLPRLEYGKESKLTGSSTALSIHSGAYNGMKNEIDGMINQFRENYPNLRVIITGGDLIYFDKKLKNNIFARPNIVLTGLNQILRHNLEN